MCRNVLGTKKHKSSKREINGEMNGVTSGKNDNSEELKTQDEESLDKLLNADVIIFYY